jgi:hypothetical protein
MFILAVSIPVVRYSEFVEQEDREEKWKVRK